MEIELEIAELNERIDALEMVLQSLLALHPSETKLILEAFNQHSPIDLPENVVELPMPENLQVRRRIRERVRTHVKEARDIIALSHPKSSPNKG